VQPQFGQDLAGMESGVLYLPIARLLLWWVGRECGRGEQQRGGGRDQRAEGREEHGSDPLYHIIVGYVGSSVKHDFIPILSRLMPSPVLTALNNAGLTKNDYAERLSQNPFADGSAAIDPKRFYMC